MLFSVNYGNLVLQALLEHWWRPLAHDDDNDGQGDSPSTAGSNTHARGGNEYFSVPGHTPVILRFVPSALRKRGSIFTCVFPLE